MNWPNVALPELGTDGLTAWRSRGSSLERGSPKADDNERTMNSEEKDQTIGLIVGYGA